MRNRKPATWLAVATPTAVPRWKRNGPYPSGQQQTRVFFSNGLCNEPPPFSLCAATGASASFARRFGVDGAATASSWKRVGSQCGTTCQRRKKPLPGVGVRANLLWKKRKLGQNYSSHFPGIRARHPCRCASSTRPLSFY